MGLDLRYDFAAPEKITVGRDYVRKEKWTRYPNISPETRSGQAGLCSGWQKNAASSPQMPTVKQPRMANPGTAESLGRHSRFPGALDCLDSEAGAGVCGENSDMGMGGGERALPSVASTC